MWLSAGEDIAIRTCWVDIPVPSMPSFYLDSIIVSSPIWAVYSGPALIQVHLKVIDGTFVSETISRDNAAFRNGYISVGA